MSDFWLNVRFWIYHLQAGRHEWWRIEVSKNYYHRGRKESSLFQVYQIGWPESYVGGMTQDANSAQD